MKALNVTTFFGNDTDPGLLLLSKSMSSHCTGNGNFVFSGTSLGDFTGAQNTWFLSVVAASTGDPQLIATAHKNRGIMEPFMTAVAEQVNTQANHDKTKLISSGGELTSVGGAIGIFKQPIIKSLTDGPVKGSLMVTLIKDPTDGFALGVMVVLTDLKTNETKTWFTTMKHIIVIPNLVSGDEYAVSFAWVGTNSTINISALLNRFAQYSSDAVCSCPLSEVNCCL